MGPNLTVCPTVRKLKFIHVYQKSWIEKRYCLDVLRFCFANYTFLKVLKLMGVLNEENFSDVNGGPLTVQNNKTK